MAEVLAIVASGVSIVQVADRLLSSIKHLHNFRKSVETFPTQIAQTIRELQILENIGRELVADLQAFDSPEGSSSSLHDSILHYQAAATSLDELVGRIDTLLSDGSRKKHIFRIKATLQKQTVQELKGQVESAKSLLQVALLASTNRYIKRRLVICKTC
jgi:hypothetical protein